MKFFIYSLFFLIPLISVSQEYATTDDGQRIKLNKDGTWEVIETTQQYRTTSTVFVGGKKLISGEKTIIHQEKYGFTTSISVAKDGGKTRIIFWQETTDDKMNFFNELWKGTIILYLENGETISFIDRNMKGQNKITNGHTSKYGSKSDLYQRFASYYITPSECIKLKSSDLSQIAYKTTSSFETGTTYLEVSQNSNTIKEQLLAIKR